MARSRAERPWLPSRQAGFVAAGEDDLQDRTVGRVEWRLLARRAGAGDREPGRVQHQIGAAVGNQLADDRRRERLLQAGAKDRQRVHAAGLQCRDQAVHRRQVAGLHQGSVEDDRRDRLAGLPVGLEVAKTGFGDCRPVQPGAQQLPRLEPACRGAELARRVGEKVSAHFPARHGRSTATGDDRLAAPGCRARQARYPAGRRPAAGPTGSAVPGRPAPVAPRHMGQ